MPNGRGLHKLNINHTESSEDETGNQNENAKTFNVFPFTDISCLIFDIAMAYPPFSISTLAAFKTSLIVKAIAKPFHFFSTPLTTTLSLRMMPQILPSLSMVGAWPNDGTLIFPSQIRNEPLLGILSLYISKESCPVQ